MWRPLTLFLVLSPLLACTGERGVEPADLVFRDGFVRTVDPGNPEAQAIA